MKNKIVLITGATSGIGWATALTLAKAGAQLILCGRRTEKLKALAKEIGGTTQLLTFDVRDKDAVFKTIASLPDPWKSIDLLVNNAGITRDGTLHRMDFNQWNGLPDL